MELYGCVVDYACRHRHLDVIYEVSRRVGCRLSSLAAVCDARLASASVLKIVQSGDAAQFPVAVTLTQCLFDLAADLDTDLDTDPDPLMVSCYAKLQCGLKVKALFHQLETCPREAFSLLRRYFPHSGGTFLRQLSAHNAVLAQEILGVGQDFRKSFLHLLGHRGSRERFLSKEYRAVYNPRFNQRLVHRAATFLSCLESCLPDTFLDEVLQGKVGVLEEGSTTAGDDHTYDHNSPTMSDVLMEVVRDNVQGKTSLQAPDLLTLLADLRDCAVAGRLDVRLSALHVRLMSSSEGGGSESSQKSTPSQGQSRGQCVRAEVNTEVTGSETEETGCHHRADSGDMQAAMNVMDDDKADDDDDDDDKADDDDDDDDDDDEADDDDDDDDADDDDDDNDDGDDHRHHPTHHTSDSPETQCRPRKHIHCLGCDQWRAVRQRAVRPSRYYGQRGTYVSPACHVALAFTQVHRDSSGKHYHLYM